MKAEAWNVNTSIVNAVFINFNDVLLLPRKRNGKFDHIIEQ